MYIRGSGEQKAFMAIASETKSVLWTLALDAVSFAPAQLLAALEAETANTPHDFRTRVLLRHSFLALKKQWGEQRVRGMLPPAALAVIDQTLAEDLGEKGFASLESRLMESTKPETIKRFLRELGSSIRESCRIHIGGSGALMLLGVLHRRTDDIDVVDEVPAPIRKDHALLESMVARYGLRLAHFQSHYLPDHWETRLKSFGVYGQLQVFLVDPVDIALGKMFSRREKDLDDLRILITSIGKATLRDRLNSSGKSLLADPQLRSNAERNWYILFGQSLPA
jgi:hypothetical protein